MGFRPIAAQYDKGGGGLGFAGPKPANPLDAVENATQLDDQRSFLFNSIYLLKSFENWDGIMPSFPPRSHEKPHPEGVPAYSLIFNTQTSRTIEGDAWGCVFIENGSAAPSKFSAKATCFPAKQGKPEYYRMTHVHFEAAANLQTVNFSSPRWTTGWGEPQEIILGRGKTSERDRKYWVLAHEMDHFTAYYDFWEFMVVKIFEAINTKYATEAECQDRIAEIRYNNLFNHLAARRRSNVFDDYPRGVPQRGNRYNEFKPKFRKDENFTWMPISAISKSEWHRIFLDKTPDRFVEKGDPKDLNINDGKPARFTEQYAVDMSAIKMTDMLLARVNAIIKSDGISYLQAEWEDLAKKAGLH